MRKKILSQRILRGITLSVLMLSSISCVDLMSSNPTSSGSSGLTTAPGVPMLLAPANRSLNVTIPPTLVWQTISGATGYTVQVATDSLFKNIFTTKSLTNVAVYVVIGLINNTKYFWRVCSTNSTGSSEYSSPYSFTTVNAAPLLLTPYNGATGQSKTPVLVWNKLNGAVNYIVEVSTNSSFTTIVITRSYVVPTTLVITGLLPNTIYYWRVRAQFAASTSNNSNPFHFTTGS